MAHTLDELRKAFFNVAYSSVASASVALRAALGDGANSIIERQELKKLPLPTAPFLAFAWPQGGGPRNRGVQEYFPILVLRDASIYGHTRLYPIIALVKAAYPEDALTMCFLDFLPVREIENDALSMPALSMPFRITTRG